MNFKALIFCTFICTGFFSAGNEDIMVGGKANIYCGHADYCSGVKQGGVVVNSSFSCGSETKVAASRVSVACSPTENTIAKACVAASGDFTSISFGVSYIV